MGSEKTNHTGSCARHHPSDRYLLPSETYPRRSRTRVQPSTRKVLDLRGRAEVKNCTIKCLLCHRRRVKPLTQKMSDLPSTRLTGVSVPFQDVGLDHTGPFSVRVGPNRIEKLYACLFTCLHMRAVHLVQ